MKVNIGRGRQRLGKGGSGLKKKKENCRDRERLG